VAAVAQRALEHCAAALDSGQSFADAPAAVEGAHLVSFQLGRSPCQQRVADSALLRLAATPGVTLDEYVRRSEDLWEYCGKPALAEAQRTVYVATTTTGKELSLAYVDRCLQAVDALNHAVCLEVFGSDLHQLGLADAPDDAARILCEGIAERLVRSSQRTAAVRIVVPWLYDRVEAAALATGSHGARATLRELALSGLNSARNFDVSKRHFDRYVATFPDDPFVENCMAWRAWLWCYEASRHRESPVLYVRSYRQAEAEYEALRERARQPVIRLNTERALHVVRRKISEVASGMQKPTIYEELAEFGPFGDAHGCLWENELQLALGRTEEAADGRAAIPIEAGSRPAPREGEPPLQLGESEGLAVLWLARLAAGLATGASPHGPATRR
jgi:hypothetical protein